jgi:hypothetical protein
MITGGYFRDYEAVGKWSSPLHLPNPQIQNEWNFTAISTTYTRIDNLLLEVMHFQSKNLQWRD